MSQEVKIGVQAQTDQAAGQIRKVEEATDALGGAIDHVAKASQAAADGMRQMEAIAQRLKNVQGVLSKELGKPIDAADAALFLSNFEQMRHGRGIGSQKTRAFGSFEDWYAGNSTMFRRRADAERHRRYVMAVGMQRTDYARQYGIPGFSGDQEGAPPPPQAPSFAENTAQRAGGMAMGFGKSMLALAGLTTITGMMGSAVDMATEQAVTIDTLKRRMGDLGVSFDSLKGQVEDAARGMGMTTVEVSRLADQFARAAGKAAPDTIGDSVRGSIGFARSFGMDPADTTQFFGLMQKLGATGGNDQNQRRFALMIAEAIEKGGYTPMANDVMAAIANFANRSAGMSLSTPNIGDYAGLLTSLMGTKLPELDPAGSAAVLDAADNAIRAGGGMGLAGLNFSYAALMRGTPGLTNPVEAEALWQGGLVGTAANVFGDDSAIGKWASSPWARSRGVKLPELSGGTNFDKMRTLMRQQYGDNPWYYLDAMQNFFGLKSISQAAALDGANPTDLTSSLKLLGRAGLQLSDLSATGIQGVAAIAGASNMGDLRSLYQGTLARSDISDAEKASLRDAAHTGNFDTLQNALVKVVGTHDQQVTEGSETRATIADMKNELTKVGHDLLGPLNLIRIAVEKMAGIAGSASTIQQPDYQVTTNPDGSQTVNQTSNVGGRYRITRPVATVPKGSIYLSPDQLQAIDDAAGGDPAKAAIMRALVTQENRGFGFANNNAVSQKGARGAWQIMPDTWAKFGDGTDFNAASGNFSAEAAAVSKFIDKIESDMGTKDPDVVAAYYNGGYYNAKDVLSGAAPRSKETRDYLAGVDANLGSTPMPASANSSGSPDDRNRPVQIAGEATIHLIDRGGNHRGSTVLRPYAAKPPAGATAWSGGASGSW